MAAGTTTLRVRIPLKKRPEIETLAVRRNAKYRQFLVDALEEAVAKGYQPKTLEPAKETRLEMSEPLKAKMRRLARTLGAGNAEDYALAVIQDILNGDFEVNGKGTRK